MTKKGTLLVKTLTEKYALTRVDNSKLSTELVPNFYNTRIINQLKKILKENGIDYTYYSKQKTLVINRYHLVISAGGDGRFSAYNKCCPQNLKFSFEANSDMALVYKLLRFKIIGIGALVSRLFMVAINFARTL